MPGGLFRLVVAGPALARGAVPSIGQETAKNVISFVRDYYGNGAHLWMYDFAALKALLEEVGFAGVRRCELGDAGDPMFALVEYQGRFFDGGERELAIEAIRPNRWL